MYYLVQWKLTSLMRDEIILKIWVSQQSLNEAHFLWYDKNENLVLNRRLSLIVINEASYEQLKCGFRWSQMMIWYMMWDWGEKLENVSVFGPKDAWEMIQGSVDCTTVAQDSNCSNSSNLFVTILSKRTTLPLHSAFFDWIWFERFV